MARNKYMDGLNNATYFPDEYAKEADGFFRAYKIESWTTCPGEKMKVEKGKNLLVCRFCGKTSDEVKFGKEAHVISELLGNRYLVSDFECDNCNELFGRNEDQLSKFLGMSRTMLFVKGKEKVPTFKSVDEGIRIKSGVQPDGEIKINISREETNGNISFDSATGLLRTSGIKQSYIPIGAYKALVKMSLSCLQEQYVGNYALAFEYIRGLGFEKEGQELAKNVVRYMFPYTFKYERPTVFIFKKRDPDAPIFNRVVILFALNSIYILPIPFDLDDLQHMGEQFELLFPPPIFTNTYHFSTTSIHRKVLDLSSSEVVKGEVDSFFLSGQPGEKVVAPIYNYETGDVEVRAFDIKDVKGFSITPVRMPD